MKQNLPLLILLILFGFQLTAQVTLEFGAISNFAEGTRDDDAIIAKTTITNNSSEKKLIIWERTVLSISDGWETAICDKNICYSPDIETFEFELDPMEEAPISVYGYPRGVEGAVTVEVKLTDTSDVNNTVTAQFEARSDGFTTTSTKFVEESNIKIYPNPTTQFISLTESTDVAQLMVYNIIGKAVKTFPINGANQYDVSNLPTGLYLVSLVDEYNQTIKTMRLRINYP